MEFQVSGWGNSEFLYHTRRVFKSFSVVLCIMNVTLSPINLQHFLILRCSEFCQYDLSKRDFTSAVDRLNANVLHLCFTQVRKNIV